MFVTIGIACLQIVLATDEASVIRSDDVHLQKQRKKSSLAAKRAMATEILPNGKAVGLRTVLIESDARQHLDHEESSKNGTSMENDGDGLHSNGTAADANASIHEALTGNQTKTNMIRRHKKHTASKKKFAVVESDAEDVKFIDATSAMFDELAEPLEVLLEQPAQAPAVLATTAPPPAATAAAAPGAAAAPVAVTTAMPTTPAPDADSGSGAGSFLGNLIYGLIVFAVVVLIVVVVGTTFYLCYGVLMELRKRDQVGSDRRVSAGSDLGGLSRITQHRQSRSGTSRTSRPMPTPIQTRGRASTAPDNDESGGGGMFSATLLNPGTPKVYNIHSTSDQEGIDSVNSASVTLSQNLGSQTPKGYRHKASRGSALLEATSTSAHTAEATNGRAPAPRDGTDSGSTSYKSRHKSSRGSSLLERKIDPDVLDGTRKKPAMEEIEEHEF
jgi:hypothetical protein